MFNLGTPPTVTLAGWALFLVFGVVFALRLKKGKLSIISATRHALNTRSHGWMSMACRRRPSSRAKAARLSLRQTHVARKEYGE